MTIEVTQSKTGETSLEFQSDLTCNGVSRTTIVEDIKIYFVDIPVINALCTLSNNMNLFQIFSIFQEILANCDKIEAVIVFQQHLQTRQWKINGKVV